MGGAGGGDEMLQYPPSMFAHSMRYGVDEGASGGKIGGGVAQTWRKNTAATTPYKGGMGPPPGIGQQTDLWYLSQPPAFGEVDKWVSGGREGGVGVSGGEGVASRGVFNQWPSVMKPSVEYPVGGQGMGGGGVNRLSGGLKRHASTYLSSQWVGPEEHADEEWVGAENGVGVDEVVRNGSAQRRRQLRIEKRRQQAGEGGSGGGMVGGGGGKGPQLG